MQDNIVEDASISLDCLLKEVIVDSRVTLPYLEVLGSKVSLS